MHCHYSGVKYLLPESNREVAKDFISLYAFVILHFSKGDTLNGAALLVFSLQECVYIIL